MSNENEVIKAPELRITKFSAVGALLVAGAATIEPLFKLILGENPEAGHKVAIFVAAIIAWAFIAAADMLARSHTSAHRQPSIASLQNAMGATYTKGRDEPGYLVVAMRFDPSSPDKPDFLLAKAGETPVWASQDDIRFD